MNTKNLKLRAVESWIIYIFFNLRYIHIYVDFLKMIISLCCHQEWFKKEKLRVKYSGINTTDLPYRWGAGTGCWAAQAINKVQSSVIPTPEMSELSIMECWSDESLSMYYNCTRLNTSSILVRGRIDRYGSLWCYSTVETTILFWFIYISRLYRPLVWIVWKCFLVRVPLGVRKLRKRISSFCFCEIKLIKQW